MNGAHVINLDEYEAIHVAAENVTYFNSFGVKHTPKEIKQEYIDWNKKTTTRHLHLSLWAESCKTNNAKSQKWPKTSISAIFLRFQCQISPNCRFL